MALIRRALHKSHAAPDYVALRHSAFDMGDCSAHRFGEMTQIHANCIALGENGILLRGPAGSGKSDLSLRLIARGARLVADDRTDLSVEDGRLFARCPQTIAGLIEIRGLGVIEGMGYLDRVEICAIVDLVGKDAVERMPDPRHETLCDVSLPVWDLWPFEASVTEKVEIVTALATGRMRARI